jgi:Arc/MetJ-type ribon-helix-helix transcriptional regulator
MSEMQVELPDATVAFIQEQVQAGHFGSASKMIEALVEDARVRAAQDRLIKLLDEGENSELIECTDEWLEQMHASLVARVHDKASS